MKPLVVLMGILGLVVFAVGRGSEEGPSPARRDPQPPNPGGMAAAGPKSQEIPAPAAPSAPPASPSPEGRPDAEPDRSANSPPRLTLGGILGAASDLIHSTTDAGDRAAQSSLHLTEEEEFRVGTDLHRQLLATVKVWEDAATLERVKRLMQPFLDRRDRKGIKYRVTLLDDPRVNAASLPGGYVYVNRGLIELAKSDAGLQFVLGHEVAHVDLGHCARLVTYRVRAGEVGGELAGAAAGLAYRMVAPGFSEDQELASDAWSFRTMRRIGRTPGEALEFLRLHRAELRREGKDQDGSREKDRPGRSRPDDAFGALAHTLEDHFASHPSIDRRIEQLERLAREPGPDLQGRAPKASQPQHPRGNETGAADPPTIVSPRTRITD
jgi:predicted Zn-dependent protease